MTAAINLVAHAWGEANIGEGDRIVLTEMEHHSNIVPWYLLPSARAPYSTSSESTMKAGWTAKPDAAPGQGPKLFAFTHVSNVLGTINPVVEITAEAKAAGAVIVIDGAQSAPAWSST